VTQHHMRGYGHPNFFGCAVCFNPWYVDFISGLSFWADYQALFTTLGEDWSVRNLLFVAYNILLGCYALWLSLQLL
jgi:hypothetical protein